MKRVGGDSGHCEREEIVEGVVIGPSERTVVDVLFDEPGSRTLEHHTPERSYPLARYSGPRRAFRAFTQRSSSSRFGSMRT